MACNPITERNVAIYMTDGRVSLVEMELMNNNFGDSSLKITEAPTRPMYCLEDMLPGMSAEHFVKF